MEENIIWIATIDPGKKNFAFIIEEVDLTKVGKLIIPKQKDRYEDDGVHTDDMKDFLYKLIECGKPIIWENVDLTKNVTLEDKYFDINVLHQLTDTLEKYVPYWNKVSYVLIEEQMSFGKKHNTMALKIAQHTLSWFMINYRSFKQYYEFPSYHKTKILGSKKKIDKPTRKKWSVNLAADFLEKRVNIDCVDAVFWRDKMIKHKKKDDVSDCMLMVYAFVILKFFDKKL